MLNFISYINETQRATHNKLYNLQLFTSLCSHTPVQQAAVMPRLLRYVRRQNAHFTEEIFFFSEEDPYKAALFLFS